VRILHDVAVVWGLGVAVVWGLGVSNVAWIVYKCEQVETSNLVPIFISTCVETSNLPIFISTYVETSDLVPIIIRTYLETSNLCRSSSALMWKPQICSYLYQYDSKT
jgi:hypothetical protein